VVCRTISAPESVSLQCMVDAGAKRVDGLPSCRVLRIDVNLCRQAVTALLSGEMRDTAELPKLPLYLTLSYLPQPTRAAMLRRCAA